MRVVYTGGTFDLFHSGHVKFLEQCRRIAGPEGQIVVGLNSDEFVFRYKNTPPIAKYNERERVLRACRHVDRVIENRHGEDSKPAILDAEATFIVIGSDWAVRDYYSQMGFTQSWLDQHGIGLLYVPYTEGISSTDIKVRVMRS